MKKKKFIDVPDSLRQAFLAGIPKVLIGHGAYYPQLKPRDIAVLICLIRRPEGELHMSADQIAESCCMSTNTVYTALKKLQQLDFVSYDRTSSGKTHWFVHLPPIEGVDVYETF